MDDDIETDSPRRSVRRWIRKANEYNEIADIAEIARRSFGNNAFDGILTMVGVIIGSFVSGIQDVAVIITTGMSTSMAITISGAWGAYLTETAERKKELKELGRSTLTDLSSSRIGRASRFAAIAVSVVDGLSPFAGATVVLLPFFFTRFFPNIGYVYLISLGTALAALFALGVWFGKVAKEQVALYGLKTLLAGLVSILVGSLLNLLIATP